MAEDDVRELGVALSDLTLQRALVGDDACRIGARVRPHARAHGRLPVPGVIVGGDHEPGLEQSADEVQVTAGMLSEPVDQLHDRSGRDDRLIDPAVDHVAPVVGRELQLIQRHGADLRGCQSSLECDTTLPMTR